MRPLRNQRIHRPALVRSAPLRHAIQGAAAVQHEAGFGFAPVRAAGHGAEAVEELERAVMEHEGGAATLSDKGRVAALGRDAEEIARGVADDACLRGGAVRAVRHRAEAVERGQLSAHGVELEDCALVRAPAYERGAVEIAGGIGREYARIGSFAVRAVRKRAEGVDRLLSPAVA